MNMGFRDFIEKLRNIRGTQAIVANINFQEELFDLEDAATHLVSRTSLFKPPSMVKCQYACNTIRVYDFESREAETTCVDYGLLVPTYEIKNKMGIDTSIVPKISGFPIQTHDDQDKLWAYVSAIYSSTQFSFQLAASHWRSHVPTLTGASEVNVSNYV